MFSQTYTAVIVMVLAQVLPHLGISIGGDELTTAVSVLATIAGGIWALYRRWKDGQTYKAGAIHWSGRRL